MCDFFFFDLCVLIRHSVFTDLVKYGEILLVHLLIWCNIQLKIFAFSCFFVCLFVFSPKSLSIKTFEKKKKEFFSSYIYQYFALTFIHFINLETSEKRGMEEWDLVDEFQESGWIPDSARKECSKCKTPFSILFRRSVFK